ncbi:MAG: hypothetical protein ABIA59_10950, partial [Candidatus Latescibacterota bacterium]
SFTAAHKDCPDDPPGTVLDSLYVVAEGFLSWYNAIEYKIVYPPEIIFQEDNTGGLDIGSSGAGIASGWALPFWEAKPHLINKVIFIWNCQGTQDEGIPITVVAHPVTGFIRAAEWGTRTFLYAEGMTGWIRASEVPVESTSWGRIKALYSN